jgi:hypothetical protein
MRIAWMVAIAMVGLLLLMGSGRAPTTPIHIDTEKGGYIYTGTESERTDRPQNLNGVIFWNSEKWVTQNTTAHKYFTDLRTGYRLKNHTIAYESGDESSGQHTVDGKTVKIASYSYDIAGRTFSATKYSMEIQERTNTEEWMFEVRSRSSGGTDRGYLHLLIQDPLGHTLVLREGIKAYSLQKSLGSFSDTDIVPSDTTFYMPNGSSVYWLDINGGSDMGGVTFKLFTESSDLSSLDMGTETVISSFEVQYTNSTGSINAIAIRPHIISVEEDGVTEKKTPFPGLVLIVAAIPLVLLLRRIRSQ